MAPASFQLSLPLPPWHGMPGQANLASALFMSNLQEGHHELTQAGSQGACVWLLGCQGVRQGANRISFDDFILILPCCAPGCQQQQQDRHVPVAPTGMDVAARLQAWRRWTGVLQRLRHGGCTSEEECLAWTGWLDALRKLADDAFNFQATGMGVEELLELDERWVLACPAQHVPKMKHLQLYSAER